jgi:hypothetical protein
MSRSASKIGHPAAAAEIASDILKRHLERLGADHLG